MTVVRKGECTHCGWCCTFEGTTIARVNNSNGISDPIYYRTRGFMLSYEQGIPVTAEAKVWMMKPCPQFRENRCSLYETRPQTCRDFPKSPDQIEGTPCTYYFEEA